MRGAPGFAHADVEEAVGAVLAEHEAGHVHAAGAVDGDLEDVELAFDALELAEESLVLVSLLRLLVARRALRLGRRRRSAGAGAARRIVAALGFSFLWHDGPGSELERSADAALSATTPGKMSSRSSRTNATETTSSSSRS